MKTSYKNMLRFTAIAALFIIFSLIGVRITTNDNWLNIKRPIAGNDKTNTDHDLTFDENPGSNDSATDNTSSSPSPDNDLPSKDNNNASSNGNVSDNNSAANNNGSSDENSSGSGNASGNSNASGNNNTSDSGTTSASSTANNSSSSNSSSAANNNPSGSAIPPSGSPGTKFTKVSAEYFDDALFIGDSRTVGLKEYGSAIKNATFFASTGMDIYQIYSVKINVGKFGKTDLMSLLKNNNYSKVYIMLGINELGYTFNNTIKKYSELIDTIRATQPGVIIYVAANMHVSASRSASDNIFNNTNINNFNNMLAKLADNKNAYYLDVNPLFDDADGNLRADYTHDNTHVLGKHYKTWADWITENAIAKPD